MQPHVKSGIILALLTALISGIANFINKYGVTAAGNPIVYTFAKNAISAAFCIGALMVFVRSKELKSLRRADWLKLVLVGGIGGSLPFVLYFTGLTLTTAVSASFLHKTLFLWVALLAVPFLKERVRIVHGFALGALLIGNAFLGNVTLLGRGELLILAATVLWAAETVGMKHLLKNISSWAMAASRMTFGSLLLFIWLAAQGRVEMLSGYSATQWGWTLAAGVLLFGYVIAWTAALKRAPAMLVSSLLVPGAFVTSLCAMLVNIRPLLPAEWWSLGFFAIGAILMIRGGKLIHIVKHADTEPRPAA